jgi:hypothetical protein
LQQGVLRYALDAGVIDGEGAPLALIRSCHTPSASAAFSRALRRLERRGLVVITYTQGRHAQRVRLTEAGRAMVCNGKTGPASAWLGVSPTQYQAHTLYAGASSFQEVRCTLHLGAGRPNRPLVPPVGHSRRCATCSTWPPQGVRFQRTFASLSAFSPGTTHLTESRG